jgi:hypothetical protein
MDEEDDRELTYQDGYKAGLREGHRLGLAGLEVANAEQAIEDESWRLDDPTGQDADDPVMVELYTNLIQARDRQLLREDPDRYSEQKHFEACSRYLP